MRALAFLVILILSGCSVFSRENSDVACPVVGFIPNADVAPLPDAEVVMGGFTAGCSFKKKSEVLVDLVIPFIVKKAATFPADMKTVGVRYFVAVLDSEERVLIKEAYSADIAVDSVPPQAEEHTVHIPVLSPYAAAQYKVAIGFILTPAQLQQNRDGNQHKKETK